MTYYVARDGRTILDADWTALKRLAAERASLIPVYTSDRTVGHVPSAEASMPVEQWPGA